MFWLLVAAALCTGFILLGNWQLRRLTWKLKLIHDVSTRVHAPPEAPPGPSMWPMVREGHLQYLHVRLNGHFMAGTPTLVHGTSPDGYGYWLMAPFQTEDGFIVLINRGYVPANWGLPSARGLLASPGNVRTITGLLRFSEPKGGFLRSNQPATNQWYSRDVDAIAQAQGLSIGLTAPYFIDEDAHPGVHAWPAGGLTKIHFRNAHLGYAITWYGMALTVLIGAGILTWRSMHPKRADTRNSADGGSPEPEHS
ncbi:MAG TPA: SURF1 family protein [Castellaniella sp.]|uniref:SURF1 family protein n=1 Tax=Castellaniella sp. TaxID=1955812 RepID=UPI002F01D684